MKQTDYWSIRMPQDERINQDTVEELRRRLGYKSAGKLVRALIERYHADDIEAYTNFTSKYTSVNNGVAE